MHCLDAFCGPSFWAHVTITPIELATILPRSDKHKEVKPPLIGGFLSLRWIERSEGIAAVAIFE